MVAVVYLAALATKASYLPRSYCYTASDKKRQTLITKQAYANLNLENYRTKMVFIIFRTVIISEWFS